MEFIKKTLTREKEEKFEDLTLKQTLELAIDKFNNEYIKAQEELNKAEEFVNKALKIKADKEARLGELNGLRCMFISKLDL